MIFEESSWTPPVELPEWMLKAPLIAVDTETSDPGLKTKGPGYCRNDGEVLGISLAAYDGGNTLRSCYLPIAHAGDNLDRDLVIRFLRDLFRDRKTLCFANAGYDLGWLRNMGISLVHHTIRDIQVAEPLLNEERQDGYSLESLSKHYLGISKDESLLRDLESQGFSGNVKANLRELPARFVGQYAEVDARNTLEIYQKQIPLLKAEGLWQLFELESKVTVVSHEMTWKGVRVDVKRAEMLNEKFKKDYSQITQRLGDLDIWSNEAVGEYLEGRGVKIPKTAKGNSSCTKQFLEHCTEPDAKRIRDARELDRIRKVFIEDGIIHGNVKGRIHAQFIQMAREEGGTRSGRFSSQNPNLQQVPSRTEYGKLVRSCYIPEDGQRWLKADYSSQEPRMQVHYALLYGYDKAEEAARSFEPDPASGKPGKLYTWFEKTIPGVTYAQAKQIFLGRSYGMGRVKMAMQLGLSEDECGEILEKFDRFVPFVDQLSKRCSNEAGANGFIRTILGRKRRFSWYQPDCRGGRDIPAVFGLEEAKKRFASHIEKGYGLTRAYTHMALNAKIQGSSADQTKKGMVDAYEAGYIPTLQVHDELDASVDGEKDMNIIKECMEHALTLRLPTVADCELKEHW